LPEIKSRTMPPTLRDHSLSDMMTSAIPFGVVVGANIT
jgi:hypothetical protein